MGKNFVLDDGCIVPDVDVFDGEGGDFGDEDAAESISKGCVDVDKGEGSFEGEIPVKLDLKGLRSEMRNMSQKRSCHIIAHEHMSKTVAFWGLFKTEVKNGPKKANHCKFTNPNSRSTYIFEIFKTP